eukprot:6409775-Alexandrium_andersonii.AAC.1
MQRVDLRRAADGARAAATTRTNRAGRLCKCPEVAHRASAVRAARELGTTAPQLPKGVSSK